MDRPNVTDAGTVPGDYAQNAGEDTYLLHILHSQRAEELWFLRIARHSPSVAQSQSINSKRCGLPSRMASYTDNVTPARTRRVISVLVSRAQPPLAPERIRWVAWTPPSPLPHRA